MSSFTPSRRPGREGPKPRSGAVLRFSKGAYYFRGSAVDPGSPMTSFASARPASTVLSPRERALVLLLYLGIGAATTIAFVLLFVISARYGSPPTSARSSGSIVTTGATFFSIGLASYVFGLRHGVDADHIAAIDNTTRKLLAEEKRPLAVGTWFSLGHSTIVVGLIVALVFATEFVNSKINFLQSTGAVVGTLISGSFLWLIGFINVLIVLEVYRLFQALREGSYNEAELEEQLKNRGFMNRYFGRLFAVIETPRQIYPVGVLFGLGFDTASEIALIAVSLAVGLSNIPIYVVLVFPLLFTCGMVLVDTTDGITMRFAYGWAFLKPIRKIYYNLTVTVISVLVAFLIGAVELLSVLASELGLTGPFWGFIEQLSFEDLGFAIIGIFVVTWLLASGYYRYKRYDDIPLAPAPSGPNPAG
jgi:high-affinity nickel-transport protein